MSNGSPARRTKIKISGSTQTASLCHTGNIKLDYYGTPQRSTMAASGSPRHLSETTKERLLASQRLSPQISGASKSRTKRKSREKPALPQMMSLNNEYLSDSSDSMHCEAPQQIATERQSSRGWVHQHFNTDMSKDQYQREGMENTCCAENLKYFLKGSALRTANSLDSLNCVSNSIQQARANSINHAQQDQVFASPLMQRINRSNSVRYT